jgi:hypothetical protein
MVEHIAWELKPFTPEGRRRIVGYLFDLFVRDSDFPGLPF